MRTINIEDENPVVVDVTKDEPLMVRIGAGRAVVQTPLTVARTGRIRLSLRWLPMRLVVDEVPACDP